MIRFFLYLVRWRERRAVKKYCKQQGLRFNELQTLCIYFKMTLTDMVAYHEFFERLPQPEYTTIIRHYGVNHLIKTVKQMASVPVEN